MKPKLIGRRRNFCGRAVLVRLAFSVVLICVSWVAASATVAASAASADESATQTESAPGFSPAPRAEARAQVLGQTERLWVIMPTGGDTLAGLALRFLGRADRAWMIAESNGLALPTAASPAAPLLSPTGLLTVHRYGANPMGFGPDGYQTVPILSYHRFGSAASKMAVTPEDFDAQLQVLADIGANVLPLAALADFLAGRLPLPAKSVVITVDDGHESFYRLAFPLLLKYRMPATLFVSTDAIGGRDSLTWQQLQTISASGLISIQAHGKTHRNLNERAPRESDRAYRRALEVEVQTPRKLIEQRLAAQSSDRIDVTVRHYAYPYGQANITVLDTLERNAFELGLGMAPGSNAFYTHPHLLQREMVLGDDSLDKFISRLQWRRELPP